MVCTQLTLKEINAWDLPDRLFVNKDPKDEILFMLTLAYRNWMKATRNGPLSLRSIPFHRPNCACNENQGRGPIAFAHGPPCAVESNDRVSQPTRVVCLTRQKLYRYYLKQSETEFTHSRISDIGEALRQCQDKNSKLEKNILVN